MDSFTKRFYEKANENNKKDGTNRQYPTGKSDARTKAIHAKKDGKKGYHASNPSFSKSQLKAIRKQVQEDD